jgi:hypothetical protein
MEGRLEAVALSEAPIGPSRPPGEPWQEGLDPAFEAEQASLKADEVAERLLSDRMGLAQVNGNTERVMELSEQRSRIAARREYLNESQRLATLQAAVAKAHETSKSVLALETELRSALARYTASMAVGNVHSTRLSEQLINEQAGLDYMLRQEQQLEEMDAALTLRISERSASVVAIRGQYEERLSAAAALESLIAENRIEAEREMRDLVASADVAYSQLSELERNHIQPATVAYNARRESIEQSAPPGTVIGPDTDIELSELQTMLEEFTAEAVVLQDSISGVETRRRELDATIEGSRLDMRRAYASAQSAQELLNEEIQRLAQDVTELHALRPMVADGAATLNAAQSHTDATSAAMTVVLAHHDDTESNIIASTQVLRTLRDAMGSIGSDQTDLAQAVQLSFLTLTATLSDMYPAGSRELSSALSRLAAAQAGWDRAYATMRGDIVRAAGQMEAALAALNQELAAHYGVPAEPLAMREEPIRGPLAGAEVRMSGLQQLADVAIAQANASAQSAAAISAALRQSAAVAGDDGGVSDDAIEAMRHERTARARNLFHLAPADMAAQAGDADQGSDMATAPE